MSLQSSASLNPVLAQLLTNYLVPDSAFVGTRIAPYFFTSEQAASYYVFDKENLASSPLLIDRAPSTEYPREQLKLSQDLYGCTNRGVEIPVDDEERRKYASAFSADDAAMRRIRNIIKVNHERRIYNKVTGGTFTSTSPTNKWDDHTVDVNSVPTSLPVEDIDIARNAIYTACGMEPNLLILPRSVFYALKEHPEILNKIKYSQKGIITVDLLSEVFNIPIAIAGGLDNSAADGQAVVTAGIWSDTVWLGVVGAANDLQSPTAIRTFVWTGMTGPDGATVESYRDDRIQSDVHRGKQYTDEKICGTQLAYTLTNVLSA